MKKMMMAGAAVLAAVAVPVLAQGQIDRSAGVTRAQAESQARALFARVDTNRDGFVTKAEAEAFRGTVRGQRQAQRGERREARFARLDANRDGSISREEFLARRQRAEGAERSERRALRAERRAERRDVRQERRALRGGGLRRLAGPRFERLDSDRDGRISLAEAVALRLQAFDRADANRDGRVTREERRALRAARQSRRG